MSEPITGPSIISELTELIVVANAGNSSFVVQTDSIPALYIDKDAKVGINNLQPTAQLEISSEAGECLKLRYADTDEVASLFMESSGDIAINPSSSAKHIKTAASLDLSNHNGNTIGLKLAGALVQATAAELNFTTVTPGQASPSKALVVNSSRGISGIVSLSATNLIGTLQTSEQPNITSIGTLDNLNVSNGVVASTLSGTLQTAAQPNITSIGTLTNLSVSNAISASALTGTLQTSAQPNITSIGNLSSITINGSIIGSEAAFLTGTVAGAAANSKALVLSSSGTISGIASLSATNLTGTLQTAAQPNITSVGTLNNLNVTNAVVANLLTGTLQTAAQPNITSLGNLSSINIAGSLIENEASFLSGVIAGTAASSKALVLSGTGTIAGITTLSATNLTGTIQTAAQPNITSIGNLTSITVSGSQIGLEASFLSGAVAGTAANSKALVLSSTGGISGIASLSATSLTGTLQTAAQPNITSLGNLFSMTVSGTATFASSSDSLSPSTGAVIVNGGIGVVKSIHVGSGVYGVIETAAQPRITSLGTLSGLTINGDLAVSGNITINGVAVGTGGGSGGSSESPFLTGVVAGTAAASKVLVLNSAGSISGITSLSATNLTGTIQTAAQPSITSLGTLTGLSISGDLDVSGSITVNGSPIGGGGSGGSESPFLTEIVPGTAAASKALVLDANRDISNINILSADSVVLGGSITVAGTQLNTASLVLLSDITEGVASESKALVVSSNRNISNINSLTAENLTGLIQTPEQPVITSLGILTGLNINGNLDITGTITLNGSPVTSGGGSGSGTSSPFLDDVVAGTAAANKALVVDNNLNISGVNVLGITSLVRNTDAAVKSQYMGALEGNTWGIGPHDDIGNKVRIGLTNEQGAWSANYPVIHSGGFNSVSDYRVKEDVVSIPYGMKEVNMLNPVKYKIKGDESNVQIGFIAHELQAIIPEVVHGVKDAVDDDGNEVHQGVSYANLTALLIKAMQEQSALIEELRREVDELKKK